MTATETPDLKSELKGTLRRVTLDRPKALNALTDAMRHGLSEILWQAARDPQVYAVALQSTSPRAFSAGSDVREIIGMATTDRPRALKAFADEYNLDWQWECFSKPTVSLINGMVMGGGVGISLYGTHRVGGEGYSFAMPETIIGLFPDVGVCHAFARMPGSIGQYLGLTGCTIKRADAYALGLLTHCIPAAEFEAIADALADTWPVDTILDDRHQDPGPGELAPLAETIDRCFSAPTVEEIMARLAAVQGPNADWAKATSADLAKRSPLSLKITHRHIRESADRDLRATLTADYRLAAHILEGHDFYEGVRAAIIEKDHAPRWQPARLEDVTPAILDGVFAPLGDAELKLPTRSDMQEMRA